MTQLQEHDLRQIFSHLEATILNRMINEIIRIENDFNYVNLRTRNRNNRTLNYFNLMHRDSYSPVIYAGAEIRKNHLPVIRFRGNNVRNNNIAEGNYTECNLIRQEEWIYVIINHLTIQSLYNLMSDECNNYPL